ncbi:transposase [Streptomyces sp. NPDC059668]|uniref:transposase n=1 Tax=Streptomyces sp. NPDC059668 TaxID=3346900 RepID=UPI0036BAAD1A
MGGVQIADLLLPGVGVKVAQLVLTDTEARVADVRLDGQRELRTLANGMRRDRAAIQAALTTTYTSGAVEGNVTRIKLLKRQMYGRANFDLLRRRILLSP